MRYSFSLFNPFGSWPSYAKRIAERRSKEDAAEIVRLREENELLRGKLKESNAAARRFLKELGREGGKPL